MTEPPIRVLVADDHAIVRTGIRHVLENEPGFTVVAEASTGAEALELASTLRPDVAVLDISMPGDSGLRIAAEAPDPVARHARADPQHARQHRVRAGEPPRRRPRLPAQGHGGHRALRRDPRGTPGRVVLQPADRGAPERRGPRRSAATPAGALGQLTARERQVLVGIAQGQTNREIAAAARHQPPHGRDPPGEPDAEAGVRTVAGLTRLALEAGLVGRDVGRVGV